MSEELVSESTINESAAGPDEARYAAAWEGSTRPKPASGTWAAVRRLAARPSARVGIAAALFAAVAGGVWLYRRTR